MEFDGDQENFRARSGPAICGAIFMCNRSTKKECFERRLFGLPPSQANFADSDGAMNIAPSAFKSSGKQFPAQVRFKQVWNCHPVPERDFRDAFKDNYYTINKFGFGLSKDQVHKLLLLFCSRKKENFRRPKNLTTTTKVVKKTGKSGLGTVRVTEKGRFVTTGRAETEHGMDNDPVPVNFSRYPPSPRPNQTSILGNSEKLFLERDDLLVEGPHRSSLQLLNSVEPRLSDLLCSTSQGDTDNQHVITPYSNSYLPRDSSFLYRNSSSFGVDHSTPACERTSYSQISTDSLFPQSRSELIPTHSVGESLIMSSTRYHSPDATDNLRDYIPLDNDILIPEYEYLGNQSVDSSNFEGYNSRLPFCEPSVATMPVLRNEKFERENMCSSSFGFTSGKVPSPVPDHDYVSRGLRYWKYEPSTATIPLSSEGKSHSQLDDYPQESPSVDLYGRLGYDYSTDYNEDYRRHISLHSDTQKTRTSVFSRLTKVKETNVQDQNYMGNTDMDLSVDQIMALLHQNQNRSWKGMKQSKQCIAHTDDHDDFDQQTKMEMNEDANLVNEEEFSEREGGETPLVNFKRRSEIRKGRSETEMEGCVKRLDCESLSVTSGKRRKLVRPSFDIKELNYDRGTACEGEGNEGNQNELSQNVGLQHKGNNDESVQGSIHEDPKGEGVSQVLGARDCLFNVNELVENAPDSTGGHKEIAEKGLSKARNELGDGFFKSESKGKTVQFSLTLNSGEEFKKEEQSQDLGARNCSLNMQMLSQDAPFNTGGQKQVAKEGSNKALEDLGDGSFKNEGKGNSVAYSLESNAGEDYKEEGQSLKRGPRDCLINIQGVVSTGGLKELAEKGSSKALQVLGDGSSKSEGKRNPAVLSMESNTGEDGQFQKLGSRDCSLNVEGLSQDATVSTGGPKQRAKKGSTKPLQELGVGSFNSEGKGKKVELSLESNTGEAFKEKWQSQGLGARDSSLKVQGLSQDAVVSAVGLKQLAKRGSTKAFQELGDGSFETEGKGKKVKFSLESNTGEGFKERGQSQRLGARECSLQGLSQDAPGRSEADKGTPEKGQGRALVQELTDGSLTCEGKRTTKESLEESNTSQADLSVGKTNSLSVSKDETTAMLVDDGVCKHESKAEELLPPSQCEPQQTTVRVKKIVKRHKMKISNPAS
ncbi:Development/cell death domain [Macleaya cordata]|uniref:Development/cell death domain n=1 Tax=Macleaya cordata TaxID=56857 RepID=A0A200QN01_MACCD|nr:Development/cell death domain [Macleaya cordata]